MRIVCSGITLAAILAGCAAPAPPAPPPPSPNDVCRTLLDSLNAAVAPGESLADLQARGVRLRTPLSFPPGTVQRPAQSSGAAVQLMIQPDGSILPGSPKTLKSVGESQIGVAMEAGALSMQFDLDAVTPKPTTPIPYTTTFAVCLRS